LERADGADWVAYRAHVPRAATLDDPDRNADYVMDGLRDPALRRRGRPRTAANDHAHPSGATVTEALNRRLDGGVGMHVRIGRGLHGSWRVFSIAAFAAGTAAFAATGEHARLPVAALLLAPMTT
jgi:hypothetical protein